MPDISMCASDICPLKTECYRNQFSGTRPSSWRQSYFVFDPDSEHYKNDGIETDECKHFWKRR